LTTLPIWPILRLPTEHTTTANRSSRPAHAESGRMVQARRRPSARQGRTHLGVAPVNAIGLARAG
jgi:hypothetical protein